MKIILVNGESRLQINEVISNIIKDNKNVTSFDLSIDSIEDIILEAGYFSLFDEEKYIVIRNANIFGSAKISEKDTELLLNYFKNPNTLTNIIFVCNEKLDNRKKITKVLKEQYEIKIIPVLKYFEIENKVSDYFKAKGYQIDKETVRYIVQNSLNQYDIVMMEIEKIMLYYEKPCTINKKDIENIISKSINTNNFALIDAIIDGNLEKSLSLWEDLKTMKVEPTVIISLLARDIRIMLQIKLLLNANKREYEILNELKLMDWQLEKYLKKAFPYKIKELEGWLVRLANLDLQIKTGKIDKFMAIDLLILDICN